MTNDITKTASQEVDGLTAELASKADAIAVRVSSVEKEMEQICMDVATDCENLESETAYAYLKRAFPEITDKANRRRYLNAGLMLNEGGRRRLPCKPPWTVAAEAYSLSSAGHKWFFSQETPPTRSAIRKYKSEERAQHKATKSQIGTMSPTDDSSSPLIHPEIDHDVTDVEQCYTAPSFRQDVSNVQPEMDSDYNRCNKGDVSMGSANDRGAAEDLEEIVRLLNIVGQLTARNCDIRGPHFNEEQWYLVWASLDSEAREAKMRCRNYEAAIVRDCDSIRAGAQARFGS